MRQVSYNVAIPIANVAKGPKEPKTSRLVTFREQERVYLYKC